MSTAMGTPSGGMPAECRRTAGRNAPPQICRRPTNRYPPSSGAVYPYDLDSGHLTLNLSVQCRILPVLPLRLSAVPALPGRPRWPR